MGIKAILHESITIHKKNEIIRTKSVAILIIVSTSYKSHELIIN